MSLRPFQTATGVPRGRRWKKVRFPGGPELSARLFTTSDGQPETAAVRNLSGIAVSLVLNHRLAPGTLVPAELRNAATAFDCQVPMRVVSSTPQADQQFIIEGAFTRELRNVEVQGLLAETLLLAD